MATIAANLAPIVRNGSSTVAAKLIVETVLTASDTFVFKRGSGQILMLRNDTAGALTVLLNGSANLAVNRIEGYPTFDTTAGYSTGSIGIGAQVAIPLDTIALYLQGTITVTGGTGINAHIIDMI